jgi:hypothetical protein
MNTQDYQQRLAQPFAEADLKWKPQAVRENRCLAIAYVTARAIMDRLDEVLTPAGWQDEYQAMVDGVILCRLSLKFGEEWITKCDVGGQSEQPDQGDKMKAAFSDALKRAAVKFGIGRYLYRLPKSWVDYDPKTRLIKTPPRLPAWAIPGARPVAAKQTNGASAGADTASPAQVKMLFDLTRQWDPAKIEQALERGYGVKLFAQLGCEQADELANRIANRVRETGSGEAAEERAAIQQEGARA